MALLSIRDITIQFGVHPLLDKINFTVKKGERVCLVGRNGAGKSTILKLLSGAINPDSGDVIISQDTKIAYLNQQIPSDISGSVFDIVSQNIVHCEQWETKHKIENILSRLSLDGAQLFESLSGGMKRRALLAKALAAEPDLLLLDEPTNHMDLENILWLESYFLKYKGTLLFVTHDRHFLQKIATRIIEIDRGQLSNWDCNYQTYLARKQEFLAAQLKQDAVFDKKLAQEEVWIRQGIKARRTRNEGRVRHLKQLRLERAARRNVEGTSKLKVQTDKKSGKLVIEATKITYGYDKNLLIDDFSTTIMRQDKIGIIGPNGCGKTTLLNLLLGKLLPQQGEIKMGTKLEIAYFDQLRAQLDEEKSLRENVTQGSDTLIINGKPKHVVGYLQDFLFSPERTNAPVKILSGGERNRLLLAKLFTKPSNVLVLDEPTNDLDIETLELLESLLVDYTGTVLLVSHDRVFLNNVVTSLLVFEDGGTLNEYVGDYNDWLKLQRAKPKTKVIAQKKPKEKATPNIRPKKLSYKEQRELEQIPLDIELLETQIDQFHVQLSDPTFYKKPKDEIVRAQDQLKAAELKLESLYQRWAKL